MRDFSSRKFVIIPPTGSCLKSNSISIYFPNRELLSLRFVLALPNVSRIVFDWIRTFFTLKTLFGAVNGKLKILLPSQFVNNCYSPFNIILWMGIRNSCDVFHNNFRCFCFSSSRLAWYHDARVLVLLFQNSISWVGYGIDVWWIFKKLPALILADEFIAIDVHYTIWIHWYRHFANVCVDFPHLISVDRENIMKYQAEIYLSMQTFLLHQWVRIQLKFIKQKTFIQKKKKIRDFLGNFIKYINLIVKFKSTVIISTQTREDV